MRCPWCRRPMQWSQYTTVPRPDILCGQNQRAPIRWAWHCRCGMWVYPRTWPPSP